MTLKEYSQDYAGDDTKLKADNLIMKELDNITPVIKLEKFVKNVLR